jgi:hypothetical protein
MKCFACLLGFALVGCLVSPEGAVQNNDQDQPGGPRVFSMYPMLDDAGNAPAPGSNSGDAGGVGPIEPQ